MATLDHKTLTLEEFLSRPETKPACEFLEGRVVQKVSPKTKHSRLQNLLCRKLDDALNPAYYAFPELRCTFSGRSLVPDVVVLARDQIPREENGEVANDVFVAPHLAVEILSPEQRVADIVEKMGFCVQNAVPLAWVIDPQAKRVVVFRPDEFPRELNDTDSLEDDSLLPGFRLPVSELFGWLRLP